MIHVLNFLVLLIVFFNIVFIVGHTRATPVRNSINNKLKDVSPFVPKEKIKDLLSEEEKNYRSILYAQNTFELLWLGASFFSSYWWELGLLYTVLIIIKGVIGSRRKTYLQTPGVHLFWAVIDLTIFLFMLINFYHLHYDVSIF
jgi:uncharacterized membrane protein